ncbi:MAG: tetratricopeptide repeat protein [Candidatus Omnitrophota bacterium]
MKKWHFIFLAFLTTFAAAIFLNTLAAPFMWDDETVILKDDYVKDLKNIPFFFTPSYWKYAFLSKKSEFISDLPTPYRPITAVSFAVDYAIWRSNPFGYHLTNVLVHVCNSALVYFLTYSLIMRYKGKEEKAGDSEAWVYILAFLSAAFFAAHPAHTESVSWIKNRSDLLCLTFFMLATIFFLKRRQSALVFFVAALFSKETAVILPIILFLYTLIFVRKGEYKAAAKRLAPFFLIAGLYILFKYSVLGTIGRTDAAPRIGLYVNLLSVSKTLGAYLKVLALPYGLNAERLFIIPKSFFEPAVLFSTASILAFLCAAVMVSRSKWEHRNLFSFAILWIFATLMPVSNIFFIWTRPIAEQRLYIPSVGFCLILALAFDALCGVKARLPGFGSIRGKAVFAAAAILIFYATTAVLRNIDWQDPAKLWLKTVESSPGSGRAHNNLGTAYERTERYREAEDEFKMAIEIDPYDPLARNNLGVVYRRTGRLDLALEQFRKAAELNPYYGEAFGNAGEVLYALDGVTDEALFYFKKALDLMPGNADAYKNLGEALFYADPGRASEAIGLSLKAIELDPGLTTVYYNLGIMYGSLALYEKAEAYYKKAIELKPDYAEAYNALGAMIYNAEPNKVYKAMEFCKKAVDLKDDLADAYYNLGLMSNSLGMFEEAVSYCDRAVKLVPGHANAHNSLGVAYRNAGRYDTAIECFKKAIEIEPGYLAAHNNLALTYYHDKKSYDLSKKEWEEVLKISPGNAAAENYLRLLDER